MVKPLIQPVQVGPVAVPELTHDAVQVEGNLWVGAYPTSQGVDPFFVGVISTVDEKRNYPGKIGQLTIRFPFEEDKVPSAERMMEVAQLAATMMKNGPLLIHSHSGRNRSCLLAAMTLVATGNFSPAEAVARVKTVRPGALKSSYEEWMMQNGAGSQEKPKLKTTRKRK